LTDSYLHIYVKHQVSTQRVATASFASKVQSADINLQVAGSGRAGNLIGGCSWLSTVIDRLHRQIFAADINCLLLSDIGLSAKQGTVICENPIHCATYNQAGPGFHRLVENWPDSDCRAG